MAQAELKPPAGPHDHAQGAAGAPVTLVEYGDYQCPYCANAAASVKRLQAEFGDRLRFVFRNFPLTQVHAFAMGAAEVAEAAGMQGKFWEMHDWLYAHQNALDPASMMAQAARLRLDMAAMKTAILDHTAAKRVQHDFDTGVESGVNGTPAFFINGNKYNGNWTDIAGFAAAIKAAGA